MPVPFVGVVHKRDSVILCDEQRDIYRVQIEPLSPVFALLWQFVTLVFLNEGVEIGNIIQQALGIRCREKSKSLYTPTY